MGEILQGGPLGRGPNGYPSGRAYRVSEWGEVVGTGLSGGVREAA